MYTVTMLLVAGVLLALPAASLVVAIVGYSNLKRRERAVRALEEKVRDLDARVGVLARRLAETAPQADEESRGPAGEAAPMPPVEAGPASAARESAAPVREPAAAASPTTGPPAEPRPGRDLEQRIGARWTTWTGIVAILFAVGFLLRWTIENNLIGPAGRVILGLASGAALLLGGLGLYRRRDLPFLSEGLAGGGLAIFYLTLFAAYDRYHFLTAASAFGLMFGVTVAGAAVSVATRRQATAVLAVLGGLITPILVASERPDERALLGYLLVLDALVLAVSRYRAWPWLNRLAWAGTVVLTMPIFTRFPAPPSLAARLALLSAIGLLFLAVPLVRSWSERRPAEPLDLVLVAGNAAAYFMGIHLTLAPSWRGAEAWWAVALAVAYAAVAEAHRRRVPGDGNTVFLHRGLAAVAMVIAAPLAFDGPWVTLAWAGLGVTLFLLAARRAADGGALLGAGLALGLAVLRVLAFDPLFHRSAGTVFDAAFVVHLAVVAALAWCGAEAGRLTLRDRGERDLRTFLWLAAAAVLALVLWREPRELWPAALLVVEMLALSWLACVLRDRAFVFSTGLLATIVLARVLVEDAALARRAAEDLLNGPLVVRIASAVAIGIAGTWVLRSEAGASAVPVGKALRAAAGVALFAVLSLGWVEHQDDRIREAARAGAMRVVRQERLRLQVGLSVLWTLYAAATLAWGFLRRAASVRWAALALLGFVVLKVFVVDLSGLQAIYRILSFLVLGVVLLGVAYFYQRRR